MLELVGYGAAFCTTVAFIPQAYKIYKSKKTEDLSLSLYVIFSIGVLLWLFYGLILDSLPMIIANIITLILSLYILYHILKNRN
ncbi:MAG: SemiSWEET transporter [Sulfurovum sp.]|jgi:MtN3 and saliva related transmembrane protein|nr:MAG: Sugar transporter SemiSWEET [Arcobacter lacus]